MTNAQLCNPTRVGQRLRDLRLAAGLTQAQVGDTAGIGRPNVCRIERGTHSLTLETLERYCSAVGVGVAAVFEAP